MPGGPAGEDLRGMEQGPPRANARPQRGLSDRRPEMSWHHFSLFKRQLVFLEGKKDHKTWVFHERKHAFYDNRRTRVRSRVVLPRSSYVTPDGAQYHPNAPVTFSRCRGAPPCAPLCFTALPGSASSWAPRRGARPAGASQPSEGAGDGEHSPAAQLFN